jgi:hypothetical protein
MKIKLQTQQHINSHLRITVWDSVYGNWNWLFFFILQAHVDKRHQDIRVIALRWILAVLFDCITKLADLVQLLLWVSCTRTSYVSLHLHVRNCNTTIMLWDGNKNWNLLLPSQSIIVAINVHLLLHFLLGLHYIKGYYPDVSMICYSKLELFYYCVVYIMSVFTNCLYLTMYILYNLLIYMLLTKSTSSFCLCDCILDLWMVNKLWWSSSFLGFNFPLCCLHHFVFLGIHFPQAHSVFT